MTIIKPTLANVIAEVERVTGCKLREIQAAQGSKQKDARRVLCAVLRNVLKLKLCRCGEIVGVVSPETVRKACVSMNDYLASYKPDHALTWPFLHIRSMFTDAPLESEKERFFVPQDR